MELIGARWRKSTRSDNGGASCVEVADNLPGMVLVRDSKDRTGPMLTFAPTVWAAFVSQVKGRQTEYGMIGYSRWRDIRAECIARAGGVEAFETGHAGPADVTGAHPIGAATPCAG